jgi:hypothetical protein
MKNTKNKVLSLLAVGVLGLAGVANAIPTSSSLAALVGGGGSIGIGDKVFSGFSYNASGLTSFNPAAITVEASILGDVYYLSWYGNITAQGLGSFSSDLSLGYTVTANPGRITMIDQFYAGSAEILQGTGLPSITIDEVVTDNSSVVVANSHLQLNDLGDPFAEAGDDLIVNPSQNVLHVIKDIKMAFLPLSTRIPTVVLARWRMPGRPRGSRK